MKIEGNNYTSREFADYVKGFDFGKVPPTSLVIHHTWRPNKEQWKGERSIQGLKTYYEGKKWSAGPHLFIAEDGVWTFTNMYDVGIHAGAGNSTYKWGRMTGYSIGIEVVGDYDLDVWTGKTKKNALTAIKVLMETLGLNNEQVFFHRDFSNKSCPGHAIKKDWLFRELSLLSSDATPTAHVNADKPSGWASMGWDWFTRNEFDLSVAPCQKVDAEWIAQLLYNYEQKRTKRKLKK